MSEFSNPGLAPATSLKDAVAAATADYSERNERSRAIAEAAARSLPGGNTRSSLWYEPYPLCMVRGEGSRLIDADDHEYIDFLGEFTAGIYGHSPEVIKEAITRALGDGMNLSSHNRWEGRLAELICARFPGMELVRFTNSGMEANLMALAAARAITGRTKILVFRGAYHGSMISFLAGGSPVNVAYEFVVGPYNDIQGTDALIRAHGNEVAAILVEPMLGAGGCIPGTPAFLSSLRQLADATGALLIFDEIQTSRLAAGGRQALLGIEPDITTLGKFYGGGLAFGCFGARRHIMERFDPRRPGALNHAGTFNNNTLTMAAGAAAVEHLLTADNLRRLNQRGEHFRETLAAQLREARAPFFITGIGSLMNIHPTGTADQQADLRKLLFFDLAADGFYIAFRGLIALSLAITEEDMVGFCRALGRFIDRRRSALSGAWDPELDRSNARTQVHADY